jgi:ketol-acid reductoisomerase
MAQGGPTLDARRKAAAAHPIEAVGARLRALMPWLEES